MGSSGAGLGQAAHFEQAPEEAAVVCALGTISCALMFLEGPRSARDEGTGGTESKGHSIWTTMLSLDNLGDEVEWEFLGPGCPRRAGN